MSHFCPDEKFVFPTVSQSDGKKQKFQRRWLQEYPWLVYSRAWNGGFCMPCLLFAPDTCKLGQLYTKPLLNFTRFKSACDRHSTYDAHKASLAMFDGFRQQMCKVGAGVSAKDSRGDIVQQLIAGSNVQSAENMEKLWGLVSIAILCGRQNIPLRAHRHEDFVPGKDEQTSRNPGNFLALVQFWAQAGDNSVARSFHMKKAGGKEVRYVSPRVQNEMIECCGQCICDSIVQKVKASPFFSVLADEATDASNKEQMAIVLHYLDMNTNSICESFMCFIECKDGTTGAALADLILSSLTGWRLDLSKLRGQGYDGASNTSGATNGCAARITAKHPAAMHLHCSAHALSLCVTSIKGQHGDINVDADKGASYVL